MKKSLATFAALTALTVTAQADNALQTYQQQAKALLTTLENKGKNIE